MRGFWPIPVLLLAALAYASWHPDSGIRTWLRLRAELRGAQAHVAELDEEVEALAREAQALAGDRFALERAIREDLGFARSGETLVLLGRSDAPGPRAGDSRP